MIELKPLLRRPAGGTALFRNIGWSFASVGARFVTAAGTLAVQARLLGPTQFGQLAFALSAATVAVLVTDFGMSLRILRTLGQREAEARTAIEDDLRLRIALMPVYAVISLAVTGVRASPATWPAYLAIFAGLALSSTTDYGLAVARGLRRYSTEACIVLITSMLQLAIVVGSVVLLPTLFGAAFGVLLSRLVTALIVFVAVERIVGRRDGPRGARRPLLDNARDALPYAQDVMLNNGLSQADLIMSGALLSPGLVGFYAIANRAFQVIGQVLGALGNVFIPSLVAAETDEARFNHVFRNLFRLILAASVVSVLGAVLVGPALQSKVLGPSYAGLTPYWLWIGAGIVGRLLAAGSAMPLTASGRQRVRVRSQIVGLAVLLLGIVPAVHLFALSGVFGAVLAAYLAIAAVQFVELRRAGYSVGRLFYLGVGLASLLAAAYWRFR